MARVLAVFAHPDDETFICGGALARAAAEGHTVGLVCATLGEMGRRMGVPPVATRESLPILRAAELRDACAALGIRDLRLLSLRDKTLEIMEPSFLADAVQAEMERFRPDVVITFHHVLGGHPDHCAIGEAAAAAFDVYAVQRSDARLYAVAWSGTEQHLKENGLRQEQWMAVDIRRHAKSKLAAFRAHRTQSGLNAWLWGADAAAAAHLGQSEHFIRLRAPFDAGATWFFAEHPGRAET